MFKKSQDLLKNVFGYDSFRPLQEACIKNVLERKDTLLIMPTGGGKSLCYQIPALIFEGLTIVVSPLISLMKDQVRQLEALGISAALLNSSLSEDEYDDYLEVVRSGKAKMLFVAPETLLKAQTLDFLKNIRVDCLTIDEAHCISDWGHDFRPEYRELLKVRLQFPGAVCLAVTATATPRVRSDIRQSLKIDTSRELIASFNRTNLFYEVIPKQTPLKQALEFIKGFPNQSGIVYCASRDQVESLAQELESRGFSAKPYHAGLSSETRSRNQDKFIRDDVQIMVATIAFGMGINKPNVRFVLHYDLPKNIESYYQETGRAGRDGLPAHCLLLFGYGDIHSIRYFINQKMDENEKKLAGFHLNSMIQYAETNGCRRLPLIKYFGENYIHEKCGLCDNCLNPKIPSFDMTALAQKFLTCMNETGQRFGAMHVIDVLRGSESEKVTRFGHQKYTSYGIGKEYSVKEWQSLARQLIQKNLIRQDEEAFGALKVLPDAIAVLKGEVTVMGFRPTKQEAKSKAPAKRKEASGEYDEAFFEVLRKKRKDLADERNVPPYIIFSDKSLIDICRKKPRSMREFATIYGVGEKKLESLGQIFLDETREYLARQSV